MVGGGQTVEGAPIIGGTIEAVVTNGNPATVGRKHIDIVNACFVVEGRVSQRDKGLAAVTAEG